MHSSANSFATKTISSINIKLLEQIIELNNSIKDEAMKTNTKTDMKELKYDKNQIDEDKNIKTNEKTLRNEQEYKKNITKNHSKKRNDSIDDTCDTRDSCNILIHNIYNIKDRNMMIHDTKKNTRKENDIIKPTKVSYNNILDSDEIREVNTIKDKIKVCHKSKKIITKKPSKIIIIRDTILNINKSNYGIHDTEQRTNMKLNTKNNFNERYEEAENTILVNDKNRSETVIGGTIIKRKSSNNVMMDDTKHTNDIMDDRISDTGMMIDTNESTDENISLFVDETVDLGLNRVVGNPTNKDGVEEIIYCDYEESLENTLTIDNTDDSYLIQNTQDNNVDIKIILDGDVHEKRSDDTQSTRVDGDGSGIKNKISKPKNSRQHFPPKQPYTIAEGQTKCDICQTECHRQKNLHTHMNIHYATHPCHICDKKYASKERLMIHLRAHLDGEFQCKYCDKVFTNYNSRHSHMWRAHNSNARFSCALCDAKFDKLSVKHAHMKFAHGLTENAYQCEECGKKFYSSDARSTHVRRVHRKISKKYRCAFCDQTFLQVKTLQRHTEKKHKDVKL